MTGGFAPRPRFYYCTDCKRTTYIGPTEDRHCEYCAPAPEGTRDADLPPKRELPDYPD